MTSDAALAALASSRQRLLAEFASLDDESFVRVPTGETWSAAHVGEHLVRVEARVTRGARTTMEKGNSVRPGFLDPLRQLTIPLGLADLVRIRTVAGADPALDAGGAFARGETLDRLAKTRADSVAFLEEFRGRDLSRTWLRHPFFGALTVPDMFGWVAWHEERHRRQVARFRRALGSS